MTEGLLLDTHVWLWLAGGVTRELKPRIRTVIDQAAASRTLYVSFISVWEIGILAGKGRILLSQPVGDWIREALSPPSIRLLALDDPATALDACDLPGRFHADPADRLLVATARRTRTTLLTRDDKILAYGRAGHVNVMAA